MIVLTFLAELARFDNSQNVKMRGVLWGLSRQLRLFQDAIADARLKSVLGHNVYFPAKEITKELGSTVEVLITISMLNW